MTAETETGEPPERLDSVAAELRAQRKRRGWTLSELSARSGVSIAAISKIENGRSLPGAETLISLARALEITVAELMDSSRPTGSAGLARLTVTRVGEGAGYSTPHYDYRLLCTGLSRKVMIPLEMVIRTREVPPRAEWSIHGGEELIHVLKGAIALHTAHYAPVRLAQGESAYFDSTMPHAFVSVGEGDAVILSICLSIRPFDDDGRFKPTRPVETMSGRDDAASPGAGFRTAETGPRAAPAARSGKST